MFQTIFFENIQAHKVGINQKLILQVMKKMDNLSITGQIKDLESVEVSKKLEGLTFESSSKNHKAANGPKMDSLHFTSLSLHFHKHGGRRSIAGIRESFKVNAARARLARG